MLIRSALALLLVPSSPFCISITSRLLVLSVQRQILTSQRFSNTNLQPILLTDTDILSGFHPIIKSRRSVDSQTNAFLSKRMSFGTKMTNLHDGSDVIDDTKTSVEKPYDATNEEISGTVTNEKVNLLDLISACIACTNTASVAIQTIQSEHAKNTRVKEDGSFVTDADYIAQGVIIEAIRSISPNIQIMGEESAEEMMIHMSNHNDTLKKISAINNKDILQRTNYEVRFRYHQKPIDICPLASSPSTPISILPQQAESSNTIRSSLTTEIDDLVDPDECFIDVSRISIVVDPLDGTNSYANGETDVVSILIGIMIDHQPCIGVIGKPFGYTGLNPMLDSTCVTIYGGSFLKGVYIAGQSDPITTLPLQTLADDQSNIDEMPRAVISSSRSKGVVHDFCVHIGEHGLIQPEPLLISGAGEKSIRLILHRNKEALWFYPKGGTSRWDVAASDALLRCLGGKLTDKYGNEINYNTTRTESENVDGVVACINAELHAKCIKLFHEGDWINQR
jgi:3'-phosphoadenosine 5'-phosphosulfate (PAPS) 3'-phosphatase